MTARERIKALLPVIQAWTEGKTIQQCRDGVMAPWIDWPNQIEPNFQAEGLHWRIKPCELWMIWKGSPPADYLQCHPYVFDDWEKARAWQAQCPGRELKLFRETDPT